MNIKYCFFALNFLSDLVLQCEGQQIFNKKKAQNSKYGSCQYDPKYTYLLINYYTLTHSKYNKTTIISSKAYQ
jgi:hypothetical protein